ncbi:MAG: cell division protein FtsH, partial [Deltaproteobacteria bacterium]|nr:cell division protein FtsH [Deltaproteobacteria bacterium]
ELARKMVTEWGMSDRIGLIHLSTRDEHIFLGKEIATGKEHSEKMQELVDEEVKRIVDEQYQRAKEILFKNLDLLHLLSEEVLNKETLDGAEIDQIIENYRKRIEANNVLTKRNGDLELNSIETPDGSQLFENTDKKA